LIKQAPLINFSIDSQYDYIPDTNYWHYALQLNMYKTILEENYGFKVSELYLVGIHEELHSILQKNKGRCFEYSLNVSIQFIF